MSSTYPAATDGRPCRHQGAVPPYLLERLAGFGERRARALSGEGPANGFAADTRGLEAVAELARRTLLEDARLRERRRGQPREDQRSIRVAPGTLHREISDAETTEDLPGRLVRKEGQDPVADADVNRAYDGLGETHRFLEQILHRSSVDGAGLALEGTVHYGVGYDNAFWDGSRMVFGDGDGRVFGPFTGSLSIIAHELGHGLLQHTTDLAYEGQAGALNESFADVFGVLVDQYARGDTAETATWIVGDGIFLPGIKGVGVRSLKAPGTAYDDPALGRDPQPAHMDGYVRTREDNGGVHLNSGIPNRAFYLAAEALGGHAWERAGRIWFETIVLGRLPLDVDFRGFARETVRVARTLFGRESAEEKAVRAGWRGVGITVRLGENGARAPRKGGTRTPGGAMRVEVIRSGGVAGIPRRARVEFRVRGAREPADDEWASLYRAARSERGRLPAAPAPQPPPRVRDAFQWTLRFGRERFDVPDATLRGALRQLAEKVLAEGQ